MFSFLLGSSACGDRSGAADSGKSPPRDTVAGAAAANRNSGGRAGPPGAMEGTPIPDPSLFGTDIIRTTGNVLEYELRPSYSGTFLGAPFRTNRWGMRDRDYDLARARGVFRIALLGSTYAMAAGVPVENSFAALLEEKLNAAAKLAGSRQRYEILNFAVGGYSMLHDVVVAEQKVSSFHPNVVLVALEAREPRLLEQHLVRLVGNSVHVPYADLDSSLRATGAAPGMTPVDATLKLRRNRLGFVTWPFKRLAESLRRRGIPAIAVVLPVATRGGKDLQQERLGDLAEEQGFRRVEADGVFDGHPRDSLLVSPNAPELSPLAHRLIAERLDRELRNKAGDLLGFSGASSGVSPSASVRPPHK